MVSSAHEAVPVSALWGGQQEIPSDKMKMDGCSQKGNGSKVSVAIFLEGRDGKDTLGRVLLMAGDPTICSVLGTWMGLP